MALKHLVAGGILCAATLAALPAAAMPVDNIARATQANANIEQVHWVCGPYRCWWRPNYYYHPRVYVAPRVWWGPRYRYRAWRRW
jgi:hypothetical protein